MGTFDLLLISLSIMLGLIVLVWSIYARREYMTKPPVLKLSTTHKAAIIYKVHLLNPQLTALTRVLQLADWKDNPQRYNRTLLYLLAVKRIDRYGKVLSINR